MADNLGSGIALDQSLDFTLTPDGDIASVSGAEEINKDIAFQLNIVLDKYRGTILTPELRANIKEDTISTITSDNRVRSVKQSSLRVGTRNEGNITVTATYTTIDANNRELVFEL